MFIFSITLIKSFVSNNSLPEHEKGRLIKNELDELKKTFENSNYWKSKYLSDLRLYTAKIEDFTGICTGLILHCYHEEFKVVLEELSMSGEETLAEEMNHILKNIRTYHQSESDMASSCKKCEECEEKPFQEFIKNFESIAQRIMSNLHSHPQLHLKKQLKIRKY